MITLDFETYYTKEYSLKKLTTEEYIRNDSFDTLGVGIKIDDQPSQWHAGDVGMLRGVLDQINWKQPVLAHNAFFDVSILGWVFGITPALILDTLCMSRPTHAHDIGASLDALCSFYNLGRKTDIDFIGLAYHEMTDEQRDEVGAYCNNDVELTYKLFQTLRVGFPVIELALIDKTIRMYSEPSLSLDTARLQDIVNSKVERTERLIRLCGRVLRRSDLKPEDFASTNRFVALLTQMGIRAPLKISPTTGLSIPALARTDMGFKGLLNSDNPATRLLALTRLEIKSVLDKTRAKSLMEVAKRGALPVMLNYYGAHTGRYSGGEKLNLQNLPRAGALRKALFAPEGHIIIASDSSQIEARITAWLAGQIDLLQQFRDYDINPTKNPSPYEVMATEIYGRTITRRDKLERFVGKTCILGLGYGMGGAKLQVSLRIGQGGISVDYSIEQCNQIVETYRLHNHRIKRLWREGQDALEAMRGGYEYNMGGKLRVDGDGILLPNGMRIKYASLQLFGEDNNHFNSSSSYGYLNRPKSLPLFMAAYLKGDTISANKLLTRIYGPKVIENVVQALARIVITEQLLKIAKRYRVALQVHDENVVVVPEAQKDEALKYIREVMITPPTWAPDLPVNCEAGIGKSYGDILK